MSTPPRKFDFVASQSLSFVGDDCVEIRLVFKKPPPPVQPGLSVGRFQRAVLEAAETFSLVSDAVPVESLVRHVMGVMEAPDGRDTRRQTTVRAVQSLAKKGLLTVAGGMVVF